MKHPLLIFSIGAFIGFTLDHPFIGGTVFMAICMALTIGWLAMGAPHDAPEQDPNDPWTQKPRESRA